MNTELGTLQQQIEEAEAQLKASFEAAKRTFEARTGATLIAFDVSIQAHMFDRSVESSLVVGYGIESTLSHNLRKP